MIDLRKEASAILGIRIEQGHWDDAFKRLDVTGHLTTKMLFSLMLLILKSLDDKTNI